MGQLLKNKMAEIKKYIDTHICKIIYVNEIANIFKIDKNILDEQFKMIYDKSPKEYIIDEKIEKLIIILRESDDGKICYYYAYKLGYETSSGLCNLIKRKTGLTFKEFKDQLLNGP